MAEWMTGTFFFYGGIGITVASVITGAVCLVLSGKKKKKLEKKLEDEYGPWNG